jgi:hypothetical protein
VKLKEMGVDRAEVRDEYQKDVEGVVPVETEAITSEQAKASLTNQSRRSDNSDESRSRPNAR